MVDPTFAVVANIYQDPEEQIPEVAAQGVTALEGWYEPLRANEPATLRRWRRWLEEAGMQVWSVHAPFGGGYNLASPDLEERRHAVEHIGQALERAAEVGASVVVVHAGEPVAGGDDPQAVERRAVDGLAELVEIAGRAGVRIALENLLPRHPGDHPEQLLRMISAFPSRWVGICFDTGHAHITGDVMDGFEALKQRVITFHLHDNDQNRDLHLPPGYGSIRWDRLACQMRQTGFADPIVLECRPWWRGDWRNLLQESRALFTLGLQRYQDGRGEAHLRCTRCGHLRFGDEVNGFCACDDG